MRWFVGEIAKTYANHDFSQLETKLDILRHFPKGGM